MPTRRRRRNVTQRNRNSAGRFNKNSNNDPEVFTVEPVGSAPDIVECPIVNTISEEVVDSSQVPHTAIKPTETINHSESHACLENLSNVCVTSLWQHSSTMQCAAKVNISKLSKDANYICLDSPPGCCQKCMRQSSECLPLQLTTTNVTVSSRGFFGAPLLENSTADLCSLCVLYLSNRNQWKFAWPSVLCSLMFRESMFMSNGEYFFSLLPSTITVSWSNAARSAGFHVNTGIPVFNDFDVINAECMQIKNVNKAFYLKNRLNFVTFPFAKCPVGCSVQLTSYSTISFKHILHFLFPSFTSFKASKIHLRGMRPDYLTAVIHLEHFCCSPCVTVNDNGLEIVTCALHENSIDKNVFHVPSSPLGNLIHSQDDRLAIMGSKLRIATPCKSGEFSNTYTMVTSKGGYGGISAVQLTKNRKFGVKSDKLLPESEKLQLSRRIDIQNFVRRLVAANNLDEEFAGYLFTPSNLLSQDVIEMHLRSSTATTLFSMLSIHRFLNSGSQHVPYIPPSLFTCHVFDDHGAEPSTPKLSCLTKNVSFFIWSLWILNYEFIGHLFLNVIPLNNQYLRYLQNQHNKKNSTISHGLQLLFETFRVAVPARVEGTSQYSLLCQIIENVPCLELIVCLHRSSLQYLLDLPSASVGENDVYCLAILCTNEPSRASEIPSIIFNRGKQFILTFVFAEHNTSILFRYGSRFHMWWKFEKGMRRFEQVHEAGGNTLKKMERSWTVLLYFAEYKHLLNDVNTSPFFSTQSSVFCNDHQLPLSIDIKETIYVCTYNECKRKSRWRCPLSSCSASCCLKHFKEFSECPTPVYLSSCVVNVNEETHDLQLDSSDCNSDTVNSDNEDFIFNGITETGHFCEPALYTETSAHMPQLENIHESVPLHVLLNQTLQLFKRTKKPENLSRQFLRIFQNFAASNPGDVVSLLQVEALLSPSVFYNQLEDGSFSGALPYYLFQSGNFNDRFGYASLYDHVYSRLTNLELPVAANIVYLHFLTDCLLNSNLHNTVTTQFFKRGLQNISIAGQTFESSSFSNMKFSLIDSEKNVRELAAAMQYRLPVVFLTLTLNQKEHPGIAPLLRAIDHLYPNKNSEEYKAAVQQYMPVILRMWDMTIHLLLYYLKNSEEAILGKITDIWGRAEFQTLVGNPPHYHFLLWIKDFDETKIDQIIVNTKKHLMDALEKMLHSDIGLIQNRQHLYYIFDKYCKIQSHSCDTRDGHCSRKRGKDGESVCRFPPYQLSNFSWLKDIPVHYSAEAYIILEKMGLVKANDGYGFDVGHELQCNKFSYPSAKNEHMMPNSPALFAITKSSGNVLFVTKNFSAKYLNKYAAGKEEHPEVLIKAGKSADSFQANVATLKNTKISGVSLHETKSANREVNGIKALHVAQTEFVWWSLRLPSIHTTFDFIHVPSLALEHRGAVLKVNSSNFSVINNAINLREELQIPTEFCFTPNQKVIIEDNASSLLSTDKVTKFSIRPPELFFIKSMKFYYSHFVHTKHIRSYKELRNILSKNPRPWVDGCNVIVKLRSSSEKLVLSYYRDLLESGYECHKISHFLTSLDSVTEYNCKSTYIYESPSLSNNPAVVVFSNVYPKEGFKFLLHLLYTMGEFDTELDLFNSPSLRDCFMKAGLLPSGELNESTALELLRKYVLEQLIFVPGGNVSFSNRLIAAHSAVTNLVLNDRSTTNDMPCVLMNKLTQSVEKKVETFFIDSQQRLFNCINPSNVTNKPLSLTDVPQQIWVPDIVQGDIQTNSSFSEQGEVIDAIIRDISALITSDESYVSKAHIIMGKPGSGKSHVSSICLLFALSNGLCAFATSLSSRRASAFNCEHIHRLFCLGVNSSTDVASAVEQALKKLEFKPERKALLLSLDVLVIEEIGLISAELLATMDLIMQSLKKNTSFFGGLFVIANGDTEQLPNIDGSDFFLSTTLLFIFQCHFLMHFVRMMDPDGKALLDMMSIKPVRLEDLEKIRSIISERCSFVESWGDINDKTVMKVFGKKAAEREAVNSYQLKIIQDGHQYIQIDSFDEMCCRHSNNWTNADKSCTDFLNAQCREPKKLILTELCLLRLTINTEDLSQGQICVLAELPNIADTSVLLFVAPYVDSVNDPDLFSLEKFKQWPLKRVHRSTGFTYAKGNVTVRRTQLPLINYVALTCHKLMGDTFAKIATQLSTTDRKYSLWMASQLYVIVSRVKQLHNVIFVGPK